MRTGLLVVLATLLAGCPYVTKEEYDDWWDQDGDTWGIDEDCAPEDPDIHPYAGDVRGDGCDADCGLELDSDGDDWPDDADCHPNDPTAYPCAPGEKVGDEIDTDCDGSLNESTDRECLGADPDFPAAPVLSASCANPAPAFE